MRCARAVISLFSSCATAVTLSIAQGPGEPWKPEVPRMWIDSAMQEIEVPLADPTGSPIHMSADYYYRIPVRPIYRSYPVYAPGHEPPGYWAELQRRKEEIVWGTDAHGTVHRPPLKNEQDWLHAGEIVFDASITYNTITTVEDVRNTDWYERTGVLTTREGIMPFFRYVIRHRGKVELGRLSCGSCHTRVMTDGSTITGAQGNFCLDRTRAYAYRTGRYTREQALDLERGLFAAHWLKDDPYKRLDTMSLEQIAAAHDSVPPGVLGRHRSSVFLPVQVPDLIGLKDLAYLDRTGLQQHRSIVDLMRYGALNQGGDALASYDGFIPDGIDFRTRPDPTEMDRYSDEQLYALALYLYSLTPPPNPNRFDSLAQKGARIFDREGCGGCHTPPLYTNNKLTPVIGFVVSPDERRKFHTLHSSVGTDPGLALATRRGTGFYKVPSLRGVWYRGPFEHDGSVATLEDWFDPNRLRKDYVPTGFKGYSVHARAVPGHEFGLDLTPEEKRALIAFLRTL